MTGTAPAKPHEASEAVDGAVVSVLRRTVEVDPADPVFAGHYPGFPILPGAFVVEMVHATVVAEHRATVTFPIAVERAKFHRPVEPGTGLRIEASLRRDGGDLVATATVSTRSGLVAEIRMRYATRTAGGGR